ncbi:MAG: HlyC/CorC family transporter [Candidatus Omnitrophica bacterium]|nr:HlyC/CorC family transporter [Candidatus Omnitrophota bacterium]
MVGLTFLFLGVLVSSALCAMTEAAILSLPFIRARILLEQGHLNARELIYIKENLPVAISSLVFINNAINIIGSIFIGEKIAGVVGSHWLGVISAVLTFLIIVLGEIIPKTFGERFKIPVSLIMAKPLRWLMFIFSPLVKGLMNLAGPLAGRQSYPKVTEDEIKVMLKLGRDAGTVEVDEEVLCSRVFKLNDVRASQIMRSFDEIYAIPASNILRDSKDLIINSPYSRIAVYEENPLDIVGVVQRSALLREIVKGGEGAAIKDFMFRPIFVADTTRADTLLAMFQKYNQHLFIVQDFSGRDVGLVTMEDVLEELFGEIYDEKDMETHAMRSAKPSSATRTDKK